MRRATCSGKKEHPVHWLRDGTGRVNWKEEKKFDVDRVQKAEESRAG